MTMRSDSPDHTRRRILEGLLVVGLAGTGLGAGTVALFSDERTTSGVLASGTVALSMEPESVVVPLSETGDGGLEVVTVTNTGSLDGELTKLRLAAATCDVDDQNRAEDRTCESDLDGDEAEGTPSHSDTSETDHLADDVYVRIGLSPTGSPEGDGTVVVVERQPLSDLDPPATFDVEEDYELAAGAQTALFVDWEVERVSGAPATDLAFELGLTIEQDLEGGDS